MSQTYKERSEAWLRERGFPMCDWLEDEAPFALRSARQVAERIVVLCGLIASVHSEGEFVGNDVLQWLEDCGAKDALSPNEAAFLLEPTPQEQVDMTWRTESAATLAWCLGWMTLESMDVQADGSWLGENVVNGDCRRLIEEARLRPEPEIHAQFDLTLRVHWAIVHHRINDLPDLPGVEPGIVYERHYAFDWLTDPEIAWDDITTDT